MNDHKNHRDKLDNRQDYSRELPIERNALIELTKKEQDHRHKLQENQQIANNISYFFGMIFGLVYNLALLYFIYDLVQRDLRSFALKLFIINAFLIITCFSLLTFSRKISFRKNQNNHKNYNRRYNNKN
jgi:uncharacterized membrane protein